MTHRASFVPVVMVVVVALLALIAMTSGRGNDTGLRGDPTYPHHICTFTEYCEGGECSREPISFIVYLTHVNDQARLEIPRVSPIADITELDGRRVFETRGGAVEGQFTIFDDLGLDWVGTSRAEEGLIEHYASGSCERLQTP